MTGFPLNPGSVTFDEDTGVYTLLITNSSGAVLPESGGPGPGWIRMIGLGMGVAAGVMGSDPIAKMLHWRR